MKSRVYAAFAAAILVAGLTTAAALVCAGCGSSGAGIAPSSLDQPGATGTVTIRIAWPESGRIIPPETASIKVILQAWGGSGQEAVREATIPQGQTTTSFTNVPAGQFGIDAWGLNSAGVPIIQGWGWGWVRHGETTAVGVSMQAIGAGYSWFHGRVKWNGANTITWPWGYLVPSVSGSWDWTLEAENGEFYYAIGNMQPAQQYHLWLRCWGFADKDVGVLLYTAPNTVRQLGDIAVLPESRGVSPVPITAEQWRERHQEMEQAREQR